MIYEYLKDVRFGGRNAWFNPIVYASFLMIERGNMNAFLYERNVCKGAKCVGLNAKIRSMYWLNAVSMRT